jgi:hypothetical protein
MRTPPEAAPTSATVASPIVELRQYTLHPGKRDTLIDLFERELIEGQEEAGMTVIGQFRDLDRAHMFVWLRGFNSMAARKAALTDFYDGPIWAAHRNAANATMIDSDDVLLLKPAWPIAGFDLSRTRRASRLEPQKASAPNHLDGNVVIEIHHLQPDAETGFARRFREAFAPPVIFPGVRLLGAFVTEHAENSFPRLPVRAGENVFVAVTRFDDDGARVRWDASTQAFLQSAGGALSKPSERLRLSPTLPSRLR